MLDILLALDGGADIIKNFKIDEPFQFMSLRESIYSAATMLEHPSYEIAGDADVKNTVRPVRDEIHIGTERFAIMQDVDGRDRPGHDGDKFEIP